MPGSEPERQVVALGSSLPVAPDALTVCDRAPCPQVEVGAADGLEGGQQQGWVVLVVSELGDHSAWS